MTAWIADVLIVLGLVVITLGVYGIVRFPDVYTQLHASSKAAFLGVSILLAATALGGGPSILARVVLIVALLAITTPVAAHAIAQAAYHQREPMRAPGAVDETAPDPREAS
jgi:multicomponent Na+:H+ antiporter subunit G